MVGEVVVGVGEETILLRVSDDVDDVEDCGVIDTGSVEERDLSLLLGCEAESISKGSKERILYLAKNVRWHLYRSPLNTIVFLEGFE